MVQELTAKIVPRHKDSLVRHHTDPVKSAKTMDENLSR